MVVIGDVHGSVLEYHQITKDNKYTLQVGDLGFKNHYDYLKKKGWSKNHLFIPGNHDDYENLPDNAIGDFGSYSHGGIDFFYVRGAMSVDREHRVEGVDWWREEELGYREMYAAFEEYAACLPDLVITHTCPYPALDLLLPPGVRRFRSPTERLLTEMFEHHRPKMWIFGHMHRSWSKSIEGTQFICLNELETFDLNKMDDFYEIVIEDSLYDESVIVYGYRDGGRAYPVRVYLDNFETLEDAQAVYPEASVDINDKHSYR